MSMSRPLATLPEELLQEIMVRLPALPQPLARASAVCPQWRRMVRDPGFLRRHREHHGGVPLTAGFFHNAFHLTPPGRFVSAGDGPLVLPVPPKVAPQEGTACCHSNPGDHHWTFLDCRGGRVLLGCCRFTCFFLVWNPITGRRRLIKAGIHQGLHFYHSVLCNATLICSSPGGIITDDDDEDGGGGAGPFCVAVVYSTVFQGDRLFGAVFSSRTGSWSTTEAPLALPVPSDLRGEPSAVVGSTVYTSVYNFLVVAFDTERWEMSTFERPRFGNVRLMKTTDGVLGLVGALRFTVQLWAREAGNWVLRTTFDVSHMTLLRDLPSAMSPSSDPRFVLLPPVKIIGVAEQGDTLFLFTMLGIFKLCLRSMELKKVCEARQNAEIVHAYASFYVP
uniref:F-box domain-containing protein n=1 Tax=Oryza brachyantha TaxID=4533 RepID=J3N0V9_ORYBR